MSAKAKDRYLFERTGEGHGRILDTQTGRATKPMVLLPSRERYLREQAKLMSENEPVARRVRWEHPMLDAWVTEQAKAWAEAGRAYQLEGMLMQARAGDDEMMRSLEEMLEASESGEPMEVVRRFVPKTDEQGRWIVLDIAHETNYGHFENEEAAQDWADAVESDDDTLASVEQERAKKEQEQ